MNVIPSSLHRITAKVGEAVSKGQAGGFRLWAANTGYLYKAFAGPNAFTLTVQTAWTLPCIGFFDGDYQSGEYATLVCGMGAELVGLGSESITLTAGAPVYLSPTTAGAVTATKPVTNGQFVQELGFCDELTTAFTICCIRGIYGQDFMPAAWGQPDCIVWTHLLGESGGTGGVTVNIFKSSNNKIMLANAAVSGQQVPCHGLLLATTAVDVAGDVVVNADIGCTAATPGAPFYLGESDGTVQDSAPSGSGKVVQKVGLVTDATHGVVNPGLNPVYTTN